MAMLAILTERVIHILHPNYIIPFILKAGDSVNNQPNDNGPNLNLKGLYGQVRMNWQRQYETLKLTNPHTTDVLVETWRDFQLSSAPVTINSSKEKSFYPSPHMTKTPHPSLSCSSPNYQR